MENSWNTWVGPPDNNVDCFISSSLCPDGGTATVSVTSCLHVNQHIRGHHVPFNLTSRALSSHNLQATSSSRPSGAASFSAQSLWTQNILYITWSTKPTN
ncbi:hypothetical protein ILYODFUR_020623 [Ilyodon furcidens]|uniref:Uncharacterized protein n=1 Tax=Ilyodon furcidens TaxID=33524 RepID=A0ABV0UV74_9TELE